MPIIWCQVRYFPLSFPNFYNDVNMLLPCSSLLLLEQHGSSHTVAAENSFPLHDGIIKCSKLSHIYSQHHEIPCPVDKPVGAAVPAVKTQLAEQGRKVKEL